MGIALQKLQKRGLLLTMAAAAKKPMVTHPLGTEIYSAKQVAESFGLSYVTILRAIKSGQLKAKKTGKNFLITREAVRDFWENLPEAEETD